MSSFIDWQNFYMIVGSSAGALIGLQFVVMTLIAEIPTSQSTAQAGEAFGTPNVVHFSVALLLSAFAAVPWQGITIVSILCSLLGLAGVAYTAVVVRRMRSQTAYHAVFEDWAFHALLPLLAYAMLAISACVAHLYPRPSLFAIGAAALLLLFIGIHNAWDTVTYHVFVRKREAKEAERNQES